MKKLHYNARPGNKSRVALKDPQVRQLAYDSLCKHLALGKKKDSWFFEHENLSCTYETFEKYLKDEREFPPIKRQIAWAKGYQLWESICEDGARGLNKDHSTATLQMIMRNKFKWDKNDSKDHDYDPQLISDLLNVTKTIADAQEARKIAKSNEAKR